MSQRVAVIDYQSGNLASAARGLQLAAARRGLDAEVVITAEPDEVRRTDLSLIHISEPTRPY